jgi:hypothetical protein
MARMSAAPHVANHDKLFCPVRLAAICARGRHGNWLDRITFYVDQHLGALDSHLRKIA